MVVDLVRGPGGRFFVEDTGFVCPSTGPVFREAISDNHMDSSAHVMDTMALECGLAEILRSMPAPRSLGLGGAVSLSSQ